MKLDAEVVRAGNLTNSKKSIFVISMIFFCSFSLRLGLSLYNRQANDAHLPVIVYIIKNNALPGKSNCHECFQPKTFYYVVAKIFSLTGLDNAKSDAQKVAGQLINFFAGCVTLVMAWIFISQIPGINTSSKVLSFALLAFNPQLIGINSQLTNDTFLIMFSVMTVYFSYLFLRNTSVWTFLLMILFGVLTVTTKTNGWVTVVAVLIALFIKFFILRPSNPKLFVYAFLYLLSIPLLTTLSPLSQYVYNYRHYGSPIVIDWAYKQPRPLFFEKTYIPDAGILSVQDGFFTFRFIDLIMHPVTGLRENLNHPTVRTSLWTQLYGSANSVHFENFPPSWRTKSELVFMINRVIFALALLPNTLLFFGFILEVFITTKTLLKRDETLGYDVSFGLFALLFTGYILFIALYAFEYRVYTFFKAIFVFPALLAFPVLFQRILGTRSFSSKIRSTVTETLISMLVFLYILDVVTLILQLLPNGSGLNMLLSFFMGR